MIYKVGLLGASGRMGQEIAGLMTSGFSPRGDILELADAVAGSGRMKHIEGVPVRKIDEPAWQTAHVWIDFSRPAATMQLLEKIECPLVVGTTGFSVAELDRLREYSTKWPVLLAPNTSPGMARMRKMLAAANFLPEERFDVVLEEDHHRHKKDAPSGTAKALLALLQELGYGEVSVSVSRAGGIVGNHRIRFISDDEEVCLEHRVWNRSVFAKGALTAALFIVRQERPALYGMDDVFAK